VAALPSEVSGEYAYQAIGEHARAVPALVLQGDTDPLVPYPNAELIVGQYLASDDWADDGKNNGSIERSASDTEMGQAPDSHSYEIDTYVDESGCILV
jgi:poly(3-hydroxybutyrate) depolymerase